MKRGEVSVLALAVILGILVSFPVAIRFDNIVNMSKSFGQDAVSEKRDISIPPPMDPNLPPSNPPPMDGAYSPSPVSSPPVSQNHPQTIPSVAQTAPAAVPSIVCGNGKCEAGESSANCIVDCPLPPLPDLSQVLSGNSLIAILPGDATILLKTYHYNVNDRAWDDTYIIKKGSITKGTASADLALILDSSYVRQISNNNFCDVVKSAKGAGSLGMEMYSSSLSLSWKYRGLASQKACFGL